MIRVLATAVVWALLLLMQFVMTHVVEREGLAGALLAEDPGFTASVALGMLVLLRLLCVVVVPAVLFGGSVEALLARALRGKKPKNKPAPPPSDSSLLERSGIG